MKAVDTNILVRFLTKDDAIQAQKVYELFKKAETKREPLFVSLLVVLELLWVLESVYSIPREEKVNYGKFGNLLAEVRAVCVKKK